MTNEQLIKKMKEDMDMRNFSKYTYDSYLGKTKDIMRYYGEKQLEEVTTEELREFLLKYLKDERKLSDRSINYYNSVIRFIYEVTLDKVLNKKQIPMMKKKKTVYKVLTKEELSTFFNVCDNFKFQTIFMLVYGSGLRVGEVANLKVEDIDSKKMRIFVREGKGNKERYTILPDITITLLRLYCKEKKIKSGYLFPGTNGKETMNSKTIINYFSVLKDIYNLNENISFHSLRHSFATYYLSNGGSLLTLQSMLGHTNLSTTTIYLHLSQNFNELEGIKYV